jgi:hypothetical protein
MESRFPEGSVMLEEVREAEREGSIVIGALGSKVHELYIQKGGPRWNSGYIDLAFFFDTDRIK